MDNGTEIRRRINYLADLIEKSDAVIKGASTADYCDYYRSYTEVVAYLNDSSGRVSDQVPALIKPNIFNRRLGGIWTITVLGLLNPFFAILIITITFPISIPYLVARGITLSHTKGRVQELKIYLTKTVNDLKAQ